MDDIAGAAAEDRVETVLAADGEACIAAILQARKSVAEIPAPGALANVAGQGANIANLRSRHCFGCFGQHRILTPNQRMAAQRVKRDEAADVHAACRRRHLVESFNGLQIYKHIRLDNKFFHHSQKIAATTDKRCGLSILPCLLNSFYRLVESLRVGVGKGFHASAPKILSREIGKSFMRWPIALKMALPTPATAWTIPASPMHLAPKGPYPSSLSMKITSISGASRWVMTEHRNSR